MEKIRIALLYGGFSSEREISIRTGKKIAENLDKEKYQIFLFDLKTDLKKFIGAVQERRVDLVFPALHGPLGEDGTVQGLMEIFHLPYVFSGVLASALAMNKDMTKRILGAENILVPRHIIVSDSSSGSLKKMSVPLVVKPVDQGSSVTTFIIKEKNKIAGAIEAVLKTGSLAMVEEFIGGREITAAVLGNEKPRALPLIEIKPKSSSFFDYRAKYDPGASEEVCPAPIDKVLTKKIQETAVKIHKIFGCRGVTRSDFIVKNNKPYFLEINTIPGMTETSLVPLAAEAAGISFAELLNRLITLALEKNNKVSI